MGDWRWIRATLVNSEKQQLQDYPPSSPFYFANRRRRSNDDTTTLLLNHDGIGERSCSDPFATSPAERLAVLNDYSHTSHQNDRVLLSEQRQWAHPLSHIERGCVLIATDDDRVVGGIFRQKVILVTSHNDEKRGMTKGIIINRPFRGNLSTLSLSRRTTTNAIENSPSLRRTFAASSVYYGGPINAHNETIIIHNHAPLDGSTTVLPGLYLGGGLEHQKAVTKEVHRGYFDPREACFVKGRVEWESRELGKEVEEGLWYVAAVSLDFMLPQSQRRQCDGGDSRGSGSSSDGLMTRDLWFDILMCLGGEYAIVAERHH